MSRGLALCLVLLVGAAATALAQAPERVVWIQQSDPPGGRRPRTQAFYEHSHFMGSDVKAININPAKPLADLAPKDAPKQRGDCIEYIFNLRKPDTFLIVATIPRGGAVGSRPGLHLAKELKLAKGETAVLKFSARRLADTTAKVSFGVGGLRVGKHVDDISSTIWTETDPVELTADWKEFSIPIVDDDGKPLQPASLISPFRVMVKEEDNPAPSKITLYVKDVRFVVKP